MTNISSSGGIPVYSNESPEELMKRITKHIEPKEWSAFLKEIWTDSEKKMRNLWIERVEGRKNFSMEAMYDSCINPLVNVICNTSKDSEYFDSEIKQFVKIICLMFHKNSRQELEKHLTECRQIIYVLAEKLQAFLEYKNKPACSFDA